MSNLCFVPNCKNSTGVPFPRDPEKVREWLEGLQLADLTPESGSFVCLSHFDPADLIYESPISRKTSNGVKMGAIPCNPNPVEMSDTSNFEEVCRACMGNKNLDGNMYEVIDLDVSIGDVFMDLLRPLEVNEEDNLPETFCRSCLTIIKMIYKFKKKCLEMHKLLCKRNSKVNCKRKLVDEEDDCVLLVSKRFQADTKDLIATSLDIPSSCDTFEVIYEDNKSSDNEDDGLSNKSGGASHATFDDIEKNMQEIHGNTVKHIEEEEEEIEYVTAVPSSTTKTTDSQGNTVEDILNTLEEGNTSVDDQECLSEFLKKSASRSLKIMTPKSKKEIVLKSKLPKFTPTKFKPPAPLKLPKNVTIKPVEKYASTIGVYPCSVRLGVYDSIFIEADEYLFELGLVKGYTRHLRCTIPTCSARANQQVFENAEVEALLHVSDPHNHQAPDELEKKKQMFLSLIRKKMQVDRTLNIRNIYEDACLQDPDIKKLVSLRNVINQVCRHQLTYKRKPINNFDDLFDNIEGDAFETLHFTHNNQQFYQEKFEIPEDGSKAVVFGNVQIIHEVSSSTIMYVDASFKIDSTEDFKYQLVTVLVWIDESYYPILFALVNKKSRLLFQKLFEYLRDELAPELRPHEIITDYEANLYYSLAETYSDSNIGGSVFYYTQNLYKKICSLNLSRDLETNSYFRNVYHMLLMLPLLPVNTILDGLNNIEQEAANLNVSHLTRPLFDHIRKQWILDITPDLFCVHKLESRINENVIAPFKKLRDFLLLTKGKLQKTQVTVMYVMEKLVELEAFLRGMYSKSDKRSFGRDLSNYQKKNVLRAWQYIEDHPKIEISNFFAKVLGYIKCMENQLWIWGFYRYEGEANDVLISSSHFSIITPNPEVLDDLVEENQEEYLEYENDHDNTIVMEAVIDQDGVLQAGSEIATTQNVMATQSPQYENAFLKYVYQ